MESKQPAKLWTAAEETVAIYYASFNVSLPAIQQLIRIKCHGSERSEGAIKRRLTHYRVRLDLDLIDRQRSSSSGTTWNKDKVGEFFAGLMPDENEFRRLTYWSPLLEVSIRFVSLKYFPAVPNDSSCT